MATQMADSDQPEMLLLTFKAEKTWSYFPWRHLLTLEGFNIQIMTHTGDSAFLI